MKIEDLETQEHKITPDVWVMGAIILTPLLLGFCYLILAPVNDGSFLVSNFFGYVGIGLTVLALNYFFPKIESATTRRIILGFLMAGLVLVILYHLYMTPPFTNRAYWWTRYGKDDGYLGDGTWSGAFLFSYVLACSVILWALCHYLYLPRRAWPGLWNLLAFFLGLMGSTYALDPIVYHIGIAHHSHYWAAIIIGLAILTGLLIFLFRRTKWPPLFILALYGGICLFVTFFLLIVYYYT